MNTSFFSKIKLPFVLFFLSFFLLSSCNYLKSTDNDMAGMTAEEKRRKNEMKVKMIKMSRSGYGIQNTRKRLGCGGDFFHSPVTDSMSRAALFGWALPFCTLSYSFLKLQNKQRLCANCSSETLRKFCQIIVLHTRRSRNSPWEEATTNILFFFLPSLLIRGTYR